MAVYRTVFFHGEMRNEGNHGGPTQLRLGETLLDYGSDCQIVLACDRRWPHTRANLALYLYRQEAG